MSGAATALDPAPSTSWSVRSLVRLRRLATALAVLAIAEAATVVLFSVVGRERFAITLDPVTFGLLGSVILFPIMGALIIQRRPVTKIAWLMIATGVGLGLGLVTYGYGVIGLAPGPERPFALQALVLSQLLFVPSIACGTALLLPLFPTDHLIGPRWRIVMVMTVVGLVVLELGDLFRQRELDHEQFPGLQNPVAAPADWTLAVDVLSLLGNALVSVAVLLGALSLVVRYRRADAVEAAQLRWFALVAGLAAVAFAISSVPVESVSDIASAAGLVLLSLTPIAIGIAITRYRLFEIDRLINRTLVYGSLTAILAGVFTAAIGLAQRVFVAATGETSDAAIVLTTLVVATLYAPTPQTARGDRRPAIPVRRTSVRPVSGRGQADPQRARTQERGRSPGHGSHARTGGHRGGGARRRRSADGPRRGVAASAGRTPGDPRRRRVARRDRRRPEGRWATPRPAVDRRASGRRRPRRGSRRGRRSRPASRPQLRPADCPSEPQRGSKMLGGRRSPASERATRCPPRIEGRKPTPLQPRL